MTNKKHNFKRQGKAIKNSEKKLPCLLLLFKWEKGFSAGESRAVSGFILSKITGII